MNNTTKGKSIVNTMQAHNTNATIIAPNSATPKSASAPQTNAGFASSHGSLTMVATDFVRKSRFLVEATKEL
jgi:hypothetical protein